MLPLPPHLEPLVDLLVEVLVREFHETGDIGARRGDPEMNTVDGRQPGGRFPSVAIAGNRATEEPRHGET